MYSMLLWMLRLSCSVGRVDTTSLHKAPVKYKVITPDSFGH